MNVLFPSVFVLLFSMSQIYCIYFGGPHNFGKRKKETHSPSKYENQNDLDSFFHLRSIPRYVENCLKHRVWNIKKSIEMNKVAMDLRRQKKEKELVLESARYAENQSEKIQNLLQNIQRKYYNFKKERNFENPYKHREYSKQIISRNT